MASDFNVFKAYNDLEKEGILVSFKGVITKELINAICEVMDEKMKTINEEPKIRKKVYNILIETLQNIYHHVDDSSFSESAEKKYKHDTIFVIAKNTEGMYSIHTGNFILNERVEKLKSKIDYVNSLSADELRDHHVNSLKTTELSHKGGAGLGIIDIARKSGNNLEYKFESISNSYSFFNLVVQVGNNGTNK